MKLTKIDLKNLVAVGHQNGTLGLLIDRGEEIEYVEVRAPEVAYEGLAQVAELAGDEPSQLSGWEDAIAPLQEAELMTLLPFNSLIVTPEEDDESEVVLSAEYLTGPIPQRSDLRDARASD
ncbi:MAG: KTSC domain-containing protein [Limnospira sp.]